MNFASREFVKELSELLVTAAKEVEVLNRHWAPEEPPLTTLFAALGDQVVVDFGCVGDDTRRQIFTLIERAMCSGDSELVTAVATGLIESIVSSVANDATTWKRVRNSFGEKSRQHADVWLNG
jgi:hypothetical protein